MGVLAPEFVLFPNSDPKYSPKSQTLIFSGLLDMRWAVLVKQFELWQRLSQRRGGHKSWVTWFRCSWILSTNMGSHLISMKFSLMPNFLTYVCLTTPKWPGTSTNLLVWIHLAPEWSKIFWLPWLISVNRNDECTPHLSKILLNFEIFDWSYFCNIQMTRNKNQFEQQKFIWAHNGQNCLKYCPIHWNQPRQSKYFWSFWSQMNSNK